MRNKTLTALSIIGFASVVSAQAQAQNIEHSLQLGLGTNFLTYDSGTITQSVPQGDGTTVEYKTIDQTTTWGLSSRNPISLEGGYGITDSLVIGGILQFGAWANNTGPQTVTALSGPRNHESRFSLFIGPKVDYMFLPDSMVRPFVGGAIGLVRRTDTLEQTNQNNVTTTNSDLGQTGIGLMARAGIRWFLTPGFSIDPAFMVGLGWTSGSTGASLGGATRNVDTSANGYTLGLSVAFSGWVGL